MATKSAAPCEFSSSLEKVLEHRLIAELTAHLWIEGVTEIEILRGEVDCHGYDLVIEAKGILRHIQLKAMARGGKRREVGIHTRLATKPSGCVIWMIYDPHTLELGPFLWFGDKPGTPLPPLGDRIGRHTKGNAEGVKLERRTQRQVGKGRFTELATIGELSRALFELPAPAPVVITPEEQLVLVKRHLSRRPPPAGPDWLCSAHAGDFSKIPHDLNWDTAADLAHLIDGYGLVKEAGWGDPFAYQEAMFRMAHEAGTWRLGAADLWVMLFLEYRRRRMSPIQPAGSVRQTLDELCCRLVTQLRSS